MEAEIINFLDKLNLSYIKITNEDSLAKVHDLLINKITFDPQNDIEIFYLGVYYQTEKNYVEMKKYYLMAIEKKDLTAMFNLGSYYKNIEKNYDEMKKYYIMAIEENSEDAIDELNKYYNNNLNENIYDSYFFKFINFDNEYLQSKLSHALKFVKKLHSEQIDNLKLHFDYSLKGKGFEEAKEDYIKLLIKN